MGDVFGSSLWAWYFPYLKRMRGKKTIIWHWSIIYSSGWEEILTKKVISENFGECTFATAQCHYLFMQVGPTLLKNLSCNEIG